LFPQQTVEELLSLAHVQAISGQAGVSMSYFDLDYGFDGTFRSIRGGGCYWAYLNGELSTNSKTVRIRIARNQLFLPDSLQWMLNNVDLGIWPC
jgi:hypothetical protein